ncbi:Poly [ADP-ribose] polymerase [Aphelenchoides fujianensis]|nr:Poly [ADP-ribose] polymerase [Aphelenchoides fujianensis]
MEQEEAVGPTELPFGAEYSKTNRATCKTCHEKIPKDHLRMAVRFPSHMFDGIQESWSHYDCFWGKPRRDINEASIRGFDTLKWEDQERIRGSIRLCAERGDNIPRAPMVKAEVAKAGSGKCTDCGEKIGKGEVRLKQSAKSYHPRCLAEKKSWFRRAADIQDFDELDEEQQAELVELFDPKKEAPAAAPESSNKRKSDGAKDENESPTKKANLEDSEERREILKKQADLIWEVITDLKGRMKKKQHIESLVAYNGSRIYTSKGPDYALELLADLVVFGGLKPCPECKGPLRYSDSEHAYKCCGSISEYTSCLYSTRDPKRFKFQVSEEMRGEFEFLAKYHNKRMLKKRFFSVLVEQDLGKKLKVTERTEKMFKVKHTEEERRCLLKNGCYVDPKCSVAEHTHVYIENSRPWQALLSHADAARGKNSFYKLQLVKDDRREEYHLFRSWGRVGANAGGTKTQLYESLEAAKDAFEELFHEKSLNLWCNVDNFEKHPGAMALVEMEYNPDAVKLEPKLDPNESKSELPLPVREALSLFFDVEQMTRQMQEFELDTQRMPLGRLSKRTILQAHGVLGELEKILQDSELELTAKQKKLLDKSNQFYSLIPHAAGMAGPPLIKTTEMLKQKTEMLDSLLEIEVAYKIVQKEASQAAQSQEEIDPFDRYYRSINCALEVVPPDSKEYEMVRLYAKNTHGSTHYFNIELRDVFRAARCGEDEKFRTDLDNHMLLWHGSRVTNFAGILSQGLRIAPPEAPVNGYMFGKGVYFADMISKSAQYCMMDNSSGDCFLLLCEVALGKVQEELHATMDKKLKDGHHSVKGLGATIPNEAQFETLEGGVVVPCGKGKTSDRKQQHSLLYNEYIVYDVNQIKIRYLVRTKIGFDD